ncbi:MAG: AAA family ATPase, partial [Ekhidna sp.]
LEKEGKRFEVKGISKEIRDKFSGRTKQIEEEVEKRDLKSALQKAALGKLTRSDKSESTVQDHELYQIWKDRLSLSEYHAIMNAKGRVSAGGKSDQSVLQSMNAKKAIDMAFSHHFERRSEIEEKLLLAYAVDLTSGQISPQELKAELAGRENIISTEIRTETHITTKEMLAEEKAMIDFASGGKNMCPPLNPDYKIQNDMLNDGQRSAIEHALNSTDKMMLISGSAGVGKTTLLQTVKEGIEEAGKTLFAFAPTAAASRGQLQDKGFEGADTIARLIRDEELQTSLQDQVIMIDEAGAVGIPTMRSIQEIAEANNARIILSGDAKQHAAVERGDAQRILQQHSKLPVAGVTEVVRQDNVKYKQAVEMLSSSLENQDDPIARKEDVAKAFDRLDEQGSIIEVEDRDARHEALAEDYLKSSEKSVKDVLLVSPTHAEGKEITEVIRGKLKEAGRLEHEDKIFDRLQSRNFTDVEKQIPENFSKGDFIEFHKNAKDGFRPGFKFEITGKDDDGNVLVQHDGLEAPVPLPLELHDRFQVFEKETIGLATGDQLRITKNLKSEENRKLFNGQKYSVTGFSKEGDIELSNGQVLSKDARHFDLGYYSTSHAAQGKDATTVIVAQSSASVGASNEKQFYVSVSRGKSDCRVYTDDKEYLREMITKSGDRLSATEIAEKAREEQREWYKQAEHVNKVKEHYELDLEPPSIKHTPHYEQKRSIGKGFEP